MAFTFLLSLLYLLPILTLSSPLFKRAPVLPSQDPFYTPPQDFASAAPGTILKSRPAPNPIAGPLNVTFELASAYQLLYRSTDSVGNPNAVVTTVLVPNNADTSKHLSFQSAYDSAYVDCSPSYTLQQGANTAAQLGTALDILFIAAAMDKGWYVSVPDYEGFKAAFTAGPQAAHATLDSIRAVIASNSITGIDQSATNVAYGYSGGALATEWAAEFQQSYAPELEIAGIAIGGMTPNITNVFNSVNGGLFAGLAPGGTLGLAKDYENLSNYINAQLFPQNASEFNTPLTNCLAKNIENFVFQDIYSYFESGENLFSNAIPQSVIAEAGIMGVHGTPSMPVWAYKAIGDEISPIADSDALVSKLCSQGANIQYVRDKFGEHITEEILGSGGAFEFIQAVMNGEPQPSGCTTQDVDISTTDGFAFFPEDILDALKALLEDPVGPSSFGG